jgi:hypothetical protein
MTRILLINTDKNLFKSVLSVSSVFYFIIYSQSLSLQPTPCIIALLEDTLAPPMEGMKNPFIGVFYFKP